MKHYTFLYIAIFLFLNPVAFSQESKKYPKDYFIKPVDIPLVLSGTFGELRSNHFHSGIDIKTQGREGLKIYSVADGYVARIKVSHWGYGKAIYIKHPNGYTTVYAHLQRFSPKIEKYIKKQQYKKESFEIQLFPSSNILPVKKGEVIGYSGNSGGSFGPHLHFEFRDSKTEKIINPLYFGIDIEDTKKPIINALIAYPLNEDSQVNQGNIPLQIPFKRLKNGDLLADKIVAFGKIGLGVNSFDRLGKAHNKNGIYKLSLIVNGEKKHKFKANTFAFNETKYINLLIDYKRLNNLKQRVQKCFIEPLNKLSMYDTSYGNGMIDIKEGLNYNVEIIASDLKGNQQKIIIPIKGKKDTLLVKKSAKKTDYYIDYQKFNKFKKSGVTVAFPKNTFYQNLHLDFKVSKGIAHIHTPTIPLHKRYTLTFDTSNLSEKEKQKMYIARIDKKGKANYAKTVKKENKFYTTTKYLGNYTLKKDSIPPKISLYKSKNGQWMTHFKTLRVKISDGESGIKSYRGEIDGHWILMEFDPKTKILTYDFNDKKFNKAKHTLKVSVIDNVGNKKVFTSTFYRKK